jgi:hypothetical protein
MRSFTVLPLRITALALVSACGGGAPEVQPQTPTPLPTSTAPAAPAVDLSPVAAPPNLVAVARVMRPSKIPGVLSAWTGLPIPIDDVLEELVGDAVSGVVDTSQPVDFAMLLDSKRPERMRPIIAVSVGVRSIDDAKASLAQNIAFTPLANGAFRLEALKNRKPRGDDDDDEPRVTRPCVLAPAYGSAAARIVCGKSNVDALWPYMVRGVTRMDVPSDLHAELRGDGFRSALGGAMPFSFLARDMRSATGQSVLADLNQFASDVDTIVLDGKLEDSGASATGAVKFREVKSPLSKIAIAHADKAGPPPAAFLKLPSESDAALFESGFESAELERGKQLAGDAIDHEMEQDGVASADRKAMVDVIRATMTLCGSPAVWAKGTDTVGAQAAIDAAKTAKPGPGQTTLERAAQAKIGGWNIFGIEEPISKVGPLAKDWAAVLARPGIAKSMSSPNMPPITFKAGAPMKGIPPNGQHWEIGYPREEWPTNLPPPPPPAPGSKPRPAPPPPKPTIVINKLHLILMPDGNRTWMVWSMDDALALDKAKALAGTSGSNLGARSGLDDLKSARANAGGFVTVRALALDSPTTAIDHSPSHYLDRPDPIWGLATSNAGQTPIPFWVGAGTNQTMSVGVSATRGVVKDGIALSRALRF